MTGPVGHDVQKRSSLPRRTSIDDERRDDPRILREQGAEPGDVACANRSDRSRCRRFIGIKAMHGRLLGSVRRLVDRTIAFAGSDRQRYCTNVRRQLEAVLYARAWLVNDALRRTARQLPPEGSLNTITTKTGHDRVQDWPA